MKAINWEKHLPNTSAKRFLSRIYKGHSKLNSKRNNAVKHNGQKYWNRHFTKDNIQTAKQDA